MRKGFFYCGNILVLTVARVFFDGRTSPCETAPMRGTRCIFREYIS